MKWGTGPRGEDWTSSEDEQRWAAESLVNRKEAMTLATTLQRERAERMPARWSRFLGMVFVIGASVAGVAAGTNASEVSDQWQQTTARVVRPTFLPPQGIAACDGECGDDSPVLVLGQLEWMDSVGGARRTTLPVQAGLAAGADQEIWVSGAAASTSDPLDGAWPSWLLVSVFAGLGAAIGRLAGVTVGWPLGWLAGFPYRRRAFRALRSQGVLPWWELESSAPGALDEVTEVDAMLMAHFTAPAAKRSGLMRWVTTPLFGPRRQAERQAASWLAFAESESGLRGEPFTDGVPLFSDIRTPKQ